jgi:hypothetical protein
MSFSLASLSTAVALVAVLVARYGIAPAADRSPVAARLRTLYTLIGMLLVLRLVNGWLDFAVVTGALMLTAAWLPLAALLLVEQLRRQHAPRFVKLGTLGGAVFFTAVALSVGIVWPRIAIMGLAAFQAIVTLGMAGLLLMSRNNLNRVERRTSDTFLLAWLLVVPLFLTDFPVLLPHTPVRGGVFAGLILVLATSGLIRGDGSPARLLADTATCLAGAGLAMIGAVLLAAEQPDLPTFVATGAVGFMVACLALLIERFAGIRSDSRRLIGAIARAPLSEGVDGLLRSHPLLSSGRLVDADMLADYPVGVVRTLARYHVISDNMGDTAACEAARDLLDATAATHLLRLSAEPPQFLAVSAGGLAGETLSDELAVAAMLIGQRT